MIITLIVTYIITVILFWNHIRNLYSEGGYYEDLDPDTIDFVLVIVPWVNTVAYLYVMCLTTWDGMEKKQKRGGWNRFFKIKK